MTPTKKNAMIIMSLTPFYSQTLRTGGYGYPNWNCSGLSRPLRTKERDTNSITKLPLPLQPLPVRHSSNQSTL